MIELVAEFWWVLIAALLIGVVVAWLLFANRRTRVEALRTGDVLDEGAAPAQRNQALIDRPAPPTAPAAPVPAAPAQLTATGGDDLSRIKGVGPKLVALLHSLGVTRFDQIAGWTDADIARIDAQLGNFSGRIERDSWVEQAGYLARGDSAGFESRFGKG